MASTGQPTGSDPRRATRLCETARIIKADSRMPFPTDTRNPTPNTCRLTPPHGSDAGRGAQVGGGLFIVSADEGDGVGG